MAWKPIQKPRKFGGAAFDQIKVHIAPFLVKFAVYAGKNGRVAQPRDAERDLSAAKCGNISKIRAHLRVEEENLLGVKSHAFSGERQPQGGLAIEQLDMVLLLEPLNLVTQRLLTQKEAFGGAGKVHFLRGNEKAFQGLSIHDCLPMIHGSSDKQSIPQDK